MNIIKSAKISRFLLKSVRDFNEFHTPRELGAVLAFSKIALYNSRLLFTLTSIDFFAISTSMLLMLLPCY